MATPVIQTSFNSGEWAPALYGRVDIQKYHSGASLLRNFFVDYRGGATTRPGSKYVLPAKSPSARLIPFKASFAVTYVLEFGPGYIRFFNNGAPILESATSITSTVTGPPFTFVDTAHGYSNNDWVSIQGNYYIVQNVATNSFTLTDLFGNAILSNPFTLPAATQRVYTISSPYLAQDLFLIKYAQDVNLLFLCHPNYAPQVLTLNAVTNWTLAPIIFTPTIAAPTGLSLSVSGTGSFVVSYLVTAVDLNGQESSPSAPVNSGAATGSSTTQSLSWTAVPGAASYNVYRTGFSATSTIPGGIPYGFIGTTTSVKFLDTAITPDASQVAPTPTNPFSGAGVNNVTVTAKGNNYTTPPNVTFTASPGVTAAGAATMTVINSGLINGGNAFVQGASYSSSYGITMQVLSLFPGTTVVQTWQLTNTGLASGTGLSLPSQVSFNAGGSLGCILSVTWGVTLITVTNPGTGYLSTPTVGFTGGGGGSGATATCTLGASSSGNPSVPGLIQQRSFFGGPAQSPAQFNLSQPGAPFNFNTSFPVSPDDAIQATLTSTTLHTIKSVLPVSAGLLIFTDQAAWILNGGAAGAPISATQLSANPQGYAGASDLPPIATPTDIIYVQAKNSIVRDLQYNFYLSNYVGQDISVLSSHFFYGFTLVQWAFAEEPFKLVWVVRSDGRLLCLTFLKEQELMAWSSHDTQGQYTSVASVNELTPLGNVDAIYVIVSRVINGVTIPYIERFVELNYPSNYRSAWQVDAGIGYVGPAATTFSGAQHLGGMAVTGVADGTVINFTMPATGTFVFGPGGTPGLTGIANASIVTVGLSFLPQLQTLPLDTGEPTIQSKRKKIAAVTVRVKDALGLQIGRQAIVAMKDLVIGNIGTMTNSQVTGLVTGDARTLVDPLWDVYGQYLIQQLQPYPATVLAVIPEIVAGDK